LPLTPEEVRHNARLARVGLSDDEVSRFQNQLSQILDYFERLQEVDTENVPPTAHTLAMHNIMRDDEPHPSIDKEEVLANAPQREDDHFRVRAILE
jgi:aspartyl-tRNA(Asn)/glutamyl-tRNA(Gln) amidotransferase subunit C